MEKMTLTDLEKRLVAKDIAWLKMSAMNAGMYPGDRWEEAPKRFAKLERLGLVSLFTPHNQAHKERAVITEAGKRVLSRIAQESAQ